MAWEVSLEFNSRMEEPVDNVVPSDSYFAHSANLGQRREFVWEHLSRVSDTAYVFGKIFGAGDEARVAGLLHDMAKFSKRFQERLNHPARVHGVDHWSFGAEWAWAQYGQKNPRLPVALECVVRGHHLGLSRAVCPSDHAERLRQAASQLKQLAEDLGENGPKAIRDRFQAASFNMPTLRKSIYHPEEATAVAGMLDVRMLFSALVDADYLETEAHFNGTADSPRVYRAMSPDLDAGRALEEVLLNLDRLRMEKNATDDVTAMRRQLLEDCLEKASGPRGLYTLTAPTGAGKTLAMLAFALKHAQTHRELRRIVVTIPFLTIIEQTANTYRKIFNSVFGDEYVVEDHSQAGHRPREALENSNGGDHDGIQSRRRLFAENWDAPLILTTSVQMLESLFSNRPGSCRKLHRLANSILLFDEVQTLPPELAVPSLAAISRLVERYGCTAVFATATQPAFQYLDSRVAEQCRLGWRPKEIVKNVSSMFAISAKRTQVEWRLEEAMPWERVANELSGREQVLCVVNLKRHAVGLIKLLEEKSVDGLLHLSTNLCPAHRESVLSEVRQRLKEGRPCRLIATQCIEAGVDVDFPAVYRALGPLEAIAQAAGRCNRGGKHTVAGQVVVFVPQRDKNEEKLYPPGYGGAAEHARSFVRDFINRHGPEAAGKLIHDPQAIVDCFRRYYNLSGKTRIPQELMKAFDERDFENVAASYHLIHGDTVRVLTPYNKQIYQALRKQTEPFLPFDRARRWFAQAAPFAVNIYRPRWSDVDISGLIGVQVGPRDMLEEQIDWFILHEDTNYDSIRLGLRSLGSDWIA